MNRLLVFLTVLSMFPIMSCAQGDLNEIQIGKIVNEKLEVTANETLLISMLNNSLKRSDVKGNIVSFKLKKDIVEGTKDTEYYILIGSNKDSSVKIATSLIKKNDILYARQLPEFSAFEETCTCSGSCTRGCDPRRWVDDYEIISWMCSACKISNKTCNKSVTTN